MTYCNQIVFNETLVPSTVEVVLPLVVQLVPFPAIRPINGINIACKYTRLRLEMHHFKGMLNIYIC